MTVSDSAVGPFVHRYLNMPLDRIETPNLQRDHTMLKERTITEGVFHLTVG